MRAWRASTVVVLGLVFAWSCPFSDEFREYLSAPFWLPFARNSAWFEKPHVRRMDAPYAGMGPAQNGGPLDKLREEYRKIPVIDYSPFPQGSPPVIKPLRQAVADARAVVSSTREKEEVDLIEAKIEMRIGESGDDGLLESAQAKLQQFLRTTRTPEFRSEARGWLAHVLYLQGDQTGAGKIYLDELNRNGSNLSRETLLNSLRINYGYDGGDELLDHLDEYFDTPEHAAFAIQLATNPHWDRFSRYESGRFAAPDRSAKAYSRIRTLLATHQKLLQASGTLPLLGMRVALRMGDPAGTRKIAEAVPNSAPIRSTPDFQWMLASSRFLSRDFAGAEPPLLALFRARTASSGQRAAAAYGLCGVYWKTGNAYERLRYALWLHSSNHGWSAMPSGVADLSVYWAASGWDLNMILEDEAPTEVLESFIRDNPDVRDIRLVKYSLAVRLTRENRYEQAAEIYHDIHALRRAPRMNQLAVLYREANREDLHGDAKLQAGYALAEFIAAHPDGIYFNDALWHGYQRYAMTSEIEYRMTGAERETLTALERKLKDDQEERWRAYLILRDVAHQAGRTPLGRKAATLAIRCLTGISERFGRKEEIRKETVAMVRALR